MSTLVFGGNCGQNKKSVVLRSPVFTQSGYGVHARQLARWLLSKDVDLSIQALSWGVTPWILTGDPLVDRLMPLAAPTRGKADVSVQVQLPNEWDPGLARFNVGVTAGVETDRCNPHWVSAVNSMDLVIVPTTFVKKTFEASGTCKTQIIVIPESYPDCFRSSPAPVDFGLTAEFNFLVVGQFTGNAAVNERKRVRETVKWLCEQFDGDENVGIVVKTNMGRNTKIDRKVCTNIINEVVGASRKSKHPRVKLVHGTLTDEEMHALYCDPKIGAFVAPTRGEGFGLPILEAAVSGIPVIATNWSGHLDFMNRGRFVKLDYVLAEIPPERVDRRAPNDEASAIFVPGVRWANVLEYDFKRKVSKIREKGDLPREWAQDLKQKLLSEYSHESVSRLYDDVLASRLVF